MNARWTFRWSSVIAIFTLLLTPIAATAGSTNRTTANGKLQALAQTAAAKEMVVWVLLREKADLSAAYAIRDRTARGRFVTNRLQATANRSQAGLRALLQSRGKQHRPFWIVNAIKVTVDGATLQELARRPEVEKIIADGAYQIPKPKPGTQMPSIQAVEWGVDRIRAPHVWSTFGDRGEGIVVANIDTGVQYDHPALVAQYRGNLGNSFDHNYNWFDPSNVCGNPSLVPCDNNAHGTHTMGTMVGDDGDPGANQIGVAPRARWIAAKGCETSSCSFDALLASGEWVLAPTNLNGQNPRPDLRPHIVNNSWGGGSGDPFYQGIVGAWLASGIFPAFANGNSGPGCGSVGSPGDYLNSYGVGAFDIGNNIAGFSSRGPSIFDGIGKPNVAAPGVDVRSSVPGNSYAVFSGTSMATPHLAGTIALIWSAAPSITGDITATRSLLNQTAIDVDDTSCGGTPENNNVWGEGMLDAFAAVEQAPRGPTGTLQGTVTDASNNPLAGAKVRAAGPTNRTITTDASGNYGLTLPVGTYDVSASFFGYLTQTATGVGINENTTTTQSFVLQLAPSHAVSGYVRDGDGAPIVGSTVTILGTPIPPATTDGNGFYHFGSVPEGEYDVQAAAGRCNSSQTQLLAVDADETLDFVLPKRVDGFGHSCEIVPFEYIQAATRISLSGDDSSTAVSLPFPFTFYDQTYDTAHVSTNGFLNFLGPNARFGNGSIPDSSPPNAAIYPFWDDLYVDGGASVHTELLGTAPNRRFAIEWRNVAFCCISEERVSFEVVLYENSHVLMQYTAIDANGREQGNSATVGLENETGTTAFQYSANELSISEGLAVLYRTPPSGFVQGTITDANDGAPVAGATVRALQDGDQIRAAITNSQGFYRLFVPLGDYMVEATARNYRSASSQVSLSQAGQIETRDFRLRTARAQVSPAALEFIVPAGQSRTKTLTLTNSGSADMTWEIRETGGGKVATSSTAVLARNPAYDANSRTTKDLYLNGAPRGWSPTAPGNVIRSWTPAGLNLPWGIGYTSNVWLSDPLAGGDLCRFTGQCKNVEFTTTGAATGRNWPAPWASVWNADMAYDASRDLMCQVNVGGDNGIYCWDPDTGAVMDSITGSFPWTTISQRGLAYRPDDDTFYIGGWNEGILYHIKGLSYADKGAVIGQCSPPDGSISGLAWNPTGIIWVATNSETDTVYQLNPDTCAVQNTLPHPNPFYNGAGLEMDEEGNLWMISQGGRTVYLIESGVPAFKEVPWLDQTPKSGTLGPGASQNIAVSANTTGLEPGVYNATLFLQSNSGRQPSQRVPVNLVVPAYQQGANAGGASYTDLRGDPWAADKTYASGSWGYVDRSSTASTRSAIAGTDDDALYQRARRGQVEYRFDGLPTGVYQIELRFAEIMNQRPGQRVFDVAIEGQTALLGHDIASEVGSLRADDHTFVMPIRDGQLNIRFLTRRSFGEPLINAIRVTHRPDR